MTTVLDWVHPSVRDLVIEYLMAHEVDRIDFIRKASGEGIVLALSTGGGRVGERELPFLQTPRDWEALALQTAELLVKGDATQHLTLLQAFEAPVRHSKGKTYRPALATVVSSCLRALRKRWNEDGQTIQHRVLRLYCSLSVVTSPLEPIPDLRATWEDATRRARSDELPASLEGIEASEEPLLSCAAWLALARLIGSNEPRFLRAVDVVEQYEASARSALTAASKWLGEVEVGVAEYDLTTEEPLGLSTDEEETLEVLDALEDPLQHIRYLFSGLAPGATEALSLRSSAASELQARADEREVWLEDRAKDMLEDWEPDDPDDLEPEHGKASHLSPAGGSA